jgi:hypothetical protein
MQNAHLRFGLLEYQRATEKISTRIRVRVDRYVGEDRKAHLLSVFGNDSDIGAITAAVHEKATFTLTFPDGMSKEVTLGENPSCYKGTINLADRKHPVCHLVAASQELHANGGVAAPSCCVTRERKRGLPLSAFSASLGSRPGQIMSSA